jgi:DNA modification methylase
MSQSTKPGDIDQLGNHRLMCGDIAQALTRSTSRLDGQKADMVFTDPPYNVAFNGRSGKFDVIKMTICQMNSFPQFIEDWLQTFEAGS